MGGGDENSPMMKLNAGASMGKERGTSKPLGSFRKTATLKVDKEGNISGWEALWDQVQMEDSKKGLIKSKIDCRKSMAGTGIT